MVSVTTHYAYQLAVNTIAPLIASSVSSLYTSYNKEEPAPTLVRAEIDDEQDLSSLQMDRLLKWMSLIFDDSITTVKTESTELKSAYKRELYSLYTTIISDTLLHNDTYLFLVCIQTKNKQNKLRNYKTLKGLIKS